jgi:hypothetical protein
MSNTEPKLGTFHNAATGEMITRELSAEEIAELPQAPDETPSPD